MHEILETFLELPTADNYRAARRQILADPEYRGDAQQLTEVAALCQRRCFATAREVALDMMPDWALSPRVHAFGEWIADALGDPNDAELEGFLRQSCLDGLLATGDGSRERPYQIMHVSDEYDILDTIGHEARSQRFVEQNASRFDVLTVASGRDFWFDVTGLPFVPRAAAAQWCRVPHSLGHAAGYTARANRALRN